MSIDLLCLRFCLDTLWISAGQGGIFTGNLGTRLPQNPWLFQITLIVLHSLSNVPLFWAKCQKLSSGFPQSEYYIPPWCGYCSWLRVFSAIFVCGYLLGSNKSKEYCNIWITGKMHFQKCISINNFRNSNN